MKITLNGHILAGGLTANEEPIHMTISAQRMLQLVKTIRASSIQTYDRGNLQICLTFEVGRRHKSQAEASQHMLLHASALTQAHGTLTLDLENGETFLLESATLQTIKTRTQGNASYTTYEIYGGNLHAH